MQAFVSGVDQCGDRQAAFDDAAILLGFRDSIPGFVAVELNERMPECGDIRILRSALGHRVDAPIQAELGAENTVDAAFLLDPRQPLGGRHGDSLAWLDFTVHILGHRSDGDIFVRSEAGSQKLRESAFDRAQAGR